MIIPIFQVNAFAAELFAGNPAAVMVFDKFPSDATLQALAAQNNLSETAFLVAESGDYALRWFTPVREVSLCGHATLASAAVVMERLERKRRRVSFRTASGTLTVKRTHSGYALNLPAYRADIAVAPIGFEQALGVEPWQFLLFKRTGMALLRSAKDVRTLTPNLRALEQLDIDAVIVTAADQDHYDFISRFFAPACGIDEDSVTGSAHCTLIPYWAKRLQKKNLYAFQASRRGGSLQCRHLGSRIEIEGSCVFYMEGTTDLR